MKNSLIAMFGFETKFKIRKIRPRTMIRQKLINGSLGRFFTVKRRCGFRRT